MPPLERKDLTDKAVLWEVSRYDGDGFPLVLAPVEISVRWEEAQVEMLDPEGQLVKVDVVAATTLNIPNGSMLWEGSLEDLETQYGSGLTPTRDIYELVTRNRGKDLKGRITRYEFGLRRYKDTLPSVVG